MKIRVMLNSILVVVLLAATPAIHPVPRVVGASPELSQPALRPLGEMLNPDGSLNVDAGFSGSLDPTGWRMDYAADDAPVFTPALAEDSVPPPVGTWNALGSGLNASVRAIAVAGTNVYVGGEFTDAGGIGAADGIARWNSATSTWYALGSGIGGGVRAIAVAGSSVYVGGMFTSAGGNTNAIRIARWDSAASTWNALGSGLNDTVRAIVVVGPDVYVGGDFTNAGGDANADYIACWHNATWFPLRYGGLGAGLNNSVYAIAAAGANLYVGGAFTGAGGVTYADYIARWNISDYTWNALGDGLNGNVYAIAVAGSNVYAGGNFTAAGALWWGNYIARWDGTTWNAVGTGLNDRVWNLAVVGPSVYAGGYFTATGAGQGANHITRWDGADWNDLGSGLNDYVMAITAEGPDLYVGGFFTDGGGIAADRIARWDTTPAAPNWDALGGGLGLGVSAIAVAGPDVYVGGYFEDAGGYPEGIARWDGSAWHALNTGLGYEYFDDVRAIVVAGPDVYVGGHFEDAGGIENADHIARWGGSSWYPLGSAGLDNNDWVFAIAVEGPDVYVGGDFIGAGGIDNADYIARWDGSAWHALSAVVSNALNGGVRAIAVEGQNVYVGGNFIEAGGNPNANYIARWDGSSWNALDGGLSYYVWAIQVAGPDVYVGGLFTDTIGNANYIARWDGSSWHAVGSGLNDYVRDISVVGPNVYVGGDFAETGDGLVVNCIVRWGTVYKEVYLPLVLRNYDPNRSVLTDPAGDWLPGAVQLASTDILAAAAERRPAEGAMIFTMELAGNLPATLPDDERNRWIWLLDTDMNAATGDPWYDIGVEYQVNLHIQSGGFYVDVRDWNNNWTPVPDAATINGSTVTVRVPVSYLGGATRFDWMAVVEPFDRVGTRFDIAPNSGYAQLP